MTRALLLLLLSATLTATRAQICVGGLKLPFDSLTNTCLASLPQDMFGTNVTLEVKASDEYIMMLIDRVYVSKNTFTFKNLSAAHTYDITLVDKNGAQQHTSLQFTFLPVLQLQGTFGYEYQAATMLLFQDGRADTLAATIKWRGGTTNSPEKHKRNYKVKLDSDKPLLGLRSDNNWILDAGQADVFRLRNRIAMDIWNDITTPPYYITQAPKARSGVSGRVVEVFLNDEYAGIYNFSENMDRKQTRVKKASGQAINGCLYKAKGWNYTLMNKASYDPYDNLSEKWGDFEVKYPDLSDCDSTDWSTLYNALCFVANSSDEDFCNQAADYFDLPPLIDYCVFGSSLNALDNYGKNMFWAVYDKNADKKLTPCAWDLDCTVGQRWAEQYNKNFSSPYFMYDMTFGLVTRLVQLNADHFIEKLNSRYDELRQTVLSTDSLTQRYTDYYRLISESGAARREEDRWSGDSDVRGETIAFSQELDYIADWIQKHLDRLDTMHFPLSIKTSLMPLQTTGRDSSVRLPAVFDLSGRRMPSDRLSKGIYIVNGKKMAVR